jgi:hypothetical protein
MILAHDKINFRFLFKDIVEGFSEVKIDGKVLFIKHLSALDQTSLEQLEENFFKGACDRGLPSEKEILARLKEEGLWGKEDESKVAQQVEYVKSLLNARKQLYLKSLIEENVTKTKEAEVKLSLLEQSKEELLGQTAEKYAKSRVSDHYVLRSFFKSRDLTERAFTEEEIDSFTQGELLKNVRTYNNQTVHFKDENIQKLVLQDFYSPYFPFSDNVMNFYNKPLFYLSTNQVKLVIFTRMFKNIFEHYPNIPEAIRKDPSKIIDYVNSQDKAKEVTETLDKDGASTVMGATKEDYEYLGYKQNPQGRSLSDMLKAKGGRMDMNDLIETMT